MVLTASFLFLPQPLFDTPTAYVIEDREGSLLSASIATDGQWRFPPSDSIPKYFRQCLIEFEDRRFNWHFGIDPLALARAVRQNMAGDRVISGASTISMQVIRMSRQRERTFIQKLIEMFLAVGLELRYSKTEILRLYADNAPFGGNVVGLEAATWRYFGRSPETLSWAESATLAVLPNAPSLIHPGKNRDALLAKRNALLDRLVSRGIISEETGELSKMEPLPDRPYPLPQHAPHLLDRYRKENQHRPARPTRLNSSLDASIQQQVMEILQRYYIRNRANGILNAAALILDVEHGSTLAYVGNIASTDAEAEPYVDMITARRSPGSTLKPFLYAAMLHDGLLLPHTLVADIPTQIGGYTPQNFDLGYDGAVPASVALSRSLNIPAVKMLQQYRYPRFHALLRQLGITTMEQPSDHYGLSMVLGGGEVTMWELAAAYANLARTLKHYGAFGGLYDPMDYHRPTYIQAAPPVGRRSASLVQNSLIDHASIYFTFQAMNEVNRPESEALWERFSSSRRIAWKTGTSFGFRDGWAIGLTPEHVVCVWVGNADGEGRPGLTGIETAAPILFEIFGLLPSDGPWFETPLDHMIQTAVCPQSGHLAGPYCAEAETRYIPSSGFKSAVCPYHRRVHTNKESNYRVSRDCADVSDFMTASWFVLPPAMEHYYKKRHASYRELPPWLPGCEPAGDAVMEMIYPRNNAKIYIPLELDGQKGRVVFSVAHQNARAVIYWHLDNEFVGETTHIHQLALDIAPGKRQLTLVDGSGNRLNREIEILEKEN